MAAEYKLQGQVAVVTGSTSGIGQAMAIALAEQGVNVVLNGFGDADKIETERAQIAAQTGVEVRYRGADMTNPAEIAEMIAYAHREFGRLDILVNNAGIQHVAAVEDFPIDKWDAIIAINLSSAFHTTRAAIPLMKAQGRGRIINLASAHGLVASPFKSAYVAAKHGIVGFTKSCALELAREGITVNAICPGYVKTPLVEAQIADQAKTRGIPVDRVVEEVILAVQPTKKFVEYDQLAGLMLYLVSDMGASSTGSAYPIDGGWTAA
jgi:3-hydroxybutyrate dehydrogenase